MDQTNYVYSNDNQGCKIVNFITPWTGVLVLGHGPISHIVKMHYFFRDLFSRSEHGSDKLSI